MPFSAVSRPDPESLRPGLLRHAERRIGPNDAPDLVQDTLCIVCRQQQEANPNTERAIESGGYAVWVYAILDNLCDWYLYERARHPETCLPPDRLLALLDTSADADLTAQAQQAEREALYALLERAHLTGVQEQCVRLWLDDHSQRQIAADLMLSRSTVRDHIAAVQVKLSKARARVVPGGALWFGEFSKKAVYHAPLATGAALDAERLAKLSQQDAAVERKIEQKREAQIAAAERRRQTR